MTESSYQPPVSQLLTYGDCRNFHDWPNYVNQLGLTAEHIPDLIRIALDPDLNWANSDSSEVWAPVHAWRSLGQLKAEAAIDPLLATADKSCDLSEGNDWYVDELPEVFAMIGAAAIPPLKAFLADSSHTLEARMFVATCFQAIGAENANLRLDCIVAMTQQLEQGQGNEPELNGALITGLIELSAVESAAAIERAFQAKQVDETITGDWNEVQIDLGLKTEAEIYHIQHSVDAENLGAWAAKPSLAPRGFGTSKPAAPKDKGKKKKK
jgi:hypothetical protein